MAQQTKIVRRSYYSKKLGRMVEKVYKYEAKNYIKKTKRKSPKKILTTSGKRVKSNIEALIKAGTQKVDIDAVISAWQKTNPGKALTKTRLEFIINRNHVQNFLDNSGLSIDQVTKELGVSENILLDENNWNNGVFTDPATGKQWTVKMNFSYDGDVSSTFTPVKDVMLNGNN